MTIETIVILVVSAAGVCGGVLFGVIMIHDLIRSYRYHRAHPDEWSEWDQ